MQCAFAYSEFVGNVAQADASNPALCKELCGTVDDFSAVIHVQLCAHSAASVSVLSQLCKTVLIELTPLHSNIKYQISVR